MKILSDNFINCSFIIFEPSCEIYLKFITAERMLEVLPVAPPPEPRQLTEREIGRLREQEEATLRELRLFLRDVLNKLGQDRKFGIFTKPVEIEDVRVQNIVVWHLSLVLRKPVFGVSDQVAHKPGCTATEDG